MRDYLETEDMSEKNKEKLYNHYWSKATEAGIERQEFETIVDWVEADSRVLDLGCGDGSLGQRLIQEKGCQVWGVDLSSRAVQLAIKKGINAQRADLDYEKLSFEDGFFNYVILCDVLEHVFLPKQILEEAKRVCQGRLIVAAPNIAYWTARLDLLRGTFPRAPLFGYQWYDSDHMTLFSFYDFLKLAKGIGLKPTKRAFIAPHRMERIPFLKNIFPNLFALVFIVELERC